MSTVVIILIAIVAALVLWGISVQNKLVQADEMCNNALKQINVQQVSRYDALQALVKLTREYASYESETLQKVISQRKITASANPTPAEIDANEAALKEMSAKLIAIAEQYPDLKANQNYQQTMQSIEKYEENVRMARMTFNDTVTKFNNQVRMFPGSVVAGILGFAKREYLAEDTSKKEYPVI
ncbi:MAG: LemA family protein [Bacteroidales bacterium]|nr:LemA family protein [Bacteroidales bacterium]MBO7641267.1 LemA family protein [Bacteroidales bacterium]